MAATDARPIPKRNTNFRLVGIVFRDADDEIITGWTTPTATKSLNNASFSACANALTEIGSSGVGYLDLNAVEVDTDSTVLMLTIGNSGAVAEIVPLYPQEDGDIEVDLRQLGGQSVIVAAPVTFHAAVGVSTVAQINFEDDYDGTGYAKPASTIGTVNELTNKIGFSLTADQTGVTIGQVNNVADKTGYSITGTLTTLDGLLASLNNLNAGEVATAVWDALQSSHTLAGSFGVLSTEIANTKLILDAWNVSEWPNNTIAHNQTQADIAALNNLSTGDIDARLAAIFLDRLFATAYNPASKPGDAGALWNMLLDSAGDFTVSALQNGPQGSGGGGGGNVTAFNGDTASVARLVAILLADGSSDLAIAANVVASDLVTTQITGGLDGNGLIEHTRGDYFFQNFEVGPMVGATRVIFTIKETAEELEDDDSNALIQIDSETGLLVAGKAAGNAAHGSITINDLNSGNIDVEGLSAAMVLMPISTDGLYFFWDIAWIDAAGNKRRTKTKGLWDSQWNVTKAVV